MAASNTNENDIQPEAVEETAPQEQPGIDAAGDEAVEESGVDVSGLAEEVQQLIAALEAERDAAVEARQRALADFSNFQRRSLESERHANSSGAARVIRALLPVLDNFDIALEQDFAAVTAEQFAEGVKIVRDELAGVLEGQGVARIAPEPGDEFDPNMHEAMLQQASEEHPSGSVVQLFQPGYAIGDLVIRAAKVAVAAQL